MIFAVLVITVTAFWPRNAALWAVAQGSSGAMTDSEAIRQMVREWVTFDWLRIVMVPFGSFCWFGVFGFRFRPGTLLERPRWRQGSCTSFASG
jgi:hypothetical protein